VGVVRDDRKFQVLSPAQIKEYLDELNWLWHPICLIMAAEMGEMYIEGDHLLANLETIL
jgi:hypothetical protein